MSKRDINKRGEILKNEAIKEIFLCGEDPIYFIENYCKIKHVEKGLLDFKLFDYQKDAIKAILANDRVIVNKARQLGYSTLLAAFIVWLILFHKDKFVLIVANKKDVAKNMLIKVKTILSHLPAWMYLAEQTENNVHTISFSNGSSVQSIARSDDAGRSHAASLLVLDEAAHIDRMAELWKGVASVVACLSGDTVVFTDSGPKEISSFFGNIPLETFVEYKGTDKIDDGESLKKISHLYKTKKTKGLVVKTQHGHEIVCTKNHPLWKLSKNPEMERSENLKIGDYLKVKTNIQKFGSKKINNDIAYILGLYTSEGFFGKYRKKDYGSLSICNSEHEIKNFLKTTNALGKTFNESSKNRSDVMVLNSKTIVQNIISEYKINPSQKAWDKEVPKEVWNLDKEGVKGYLQGLFDGDGCACSRGVILTSTSEKLVKQINLILLNFGIIANIQKTPKEKILNEENRSKRLLPQGRRLQSAHDVYRLYIPHSQTKKFIEEIGFRLKRKNEAAIKITKTRKQDDKKLYKIPSWSVKDRLIEMVEKDLTPTHFYRKNGLRLDKLFLEDNKKERFINVEFIKKFKRIYQENNDLTPQEERFFEQFESENWFWDKVIEIKESEEQTFYDFTVPGSHKFLQNGILGSNTGGKVVALSSPRGVGNWFYEYYTKAESGEIDWYAIETIWWEHPDFALGLEEDPNTPGGKTSPWFRKATEGWSRQQIAQELLTSFVESGDNFFDVATIQHYLAIAKNPEWREGPDKNLWVWKRAVPGHRYLISADVCLGNGPDYASCVVIELADLEIVAEYKGKMPPDMFGDFLIDLGISYNEAFLCPENQGIGLSCGLHIKNMGYKNLCFFEKDTGRLIDKWKAEYSGVMPGQPMTAKERSMMLSKTEEMFRKKLVKSYSKRLANEIQTFIIRNGKPQAEGGTNDDLIMATAIGIWVRDVCPEFRSETSVVDSSALISAITRVNTNYNSTNSYEYKVAEHKKRIHQMVEAQKMPLHIARGHNPWLYKV